MKKYVVENLSVGYEGWLEDADKSNNVGFRIGSRYINHLTSGIHTGNLTLYLAGIGQGKTSSSVPLFILPSIEDGENITIICNEQNSDEYRSMIISTVLFGKIGYTENISRQKLNMGKFTDIQKKKIKEAMNWIKNQKGTIRFIEARDFDMNEVNEIIQEESSDCKIFLIDVLKNNSDVNDSAWQQLSDSARKMYITAREKDVAIIATAQLTHDSMYKKMLDLSSVGKSKAITECASTVVAFRSVSKQELLKIKPFVFKKDGGKNFIKLDSEKHYIVVFIMKNRFGSTTPQIIMEFNQNYNLLSDVGFVDMMYD